MKIIFLTGSYLPYGSPNAICISKIIKRLVAEGESTSVITTKNHLDLPEKREIDGCEVHYLDPGLLCKWQYLNEEKTSKLRTFFLSIAWKFKGGFYGLFWPLISWSAIWRYYHETVRMIKSCTKEEEIVLISVYKLLEPNIAGVLLKRKYPNIRYIFYALDSISGSIIPRVLKNDKIGKASTKRWERLIFNYADSICLMKSHRTYYMSREYDKFREKIKYMDIPLISDTIPRAIPRSNSSEIKFVYTGWMSKQTADPEYFVRMLSLSDLCKVAKFDIYGNVTQEIQNSIKQTGAEFVQVHGKIPYEQISLIQQNADFLLNFGNINPCAIPCKIFEYISTHRPIISLYKTDEDASNPYLRKYPWALLLDERKPMQDNLQLLLKFINRIQNSIRTPINIQSLFFDNTAVPMTREILGRD